MAPVRSGRKGRSPFGGEQVAAAKDPSHGLAVIGAGVGQQLLGLDPEEIGDVARREPGPVNPPGELGHDPLGVAHAGGQGVGMAVRPAHTPPRPATGQVGPGHMAEVAQVEGLGQGDAQVLEGVDRAGLAVGERAAVDGASIAPDS